MTSGMILYALAAFGGYTALRWLRNEFKPKPSYAPLFRGLRGPHNGH